MPLRDRELVDRILKGDPDAWHCLVDRYSEFIYAVLADFRLVGPVDRDDLLQDLFAHLHKDGCEALRAWRGKEHDSLKPYLAIIVRRMALNTLRGRHQARDSVNLEDAGSVAAEDCAPEEEVWLGEMRRIIARVASEVLNRRELDAMNRYVNGESRAEIAAALGVTANNAGVILNRASNKLMKALQERHPALFSGD